MKPKDEIAQLVIRGKDLRDQAERAISNLLHSDGAPILGDLFVKTVVPYGYKGTARKAGNVGHKNAKLNVNSKWRKVGTTFLVECEAKVREMSINTRNLTSKGNSSLLVRKFNRSRRIKGPITFFDSIITTLEEIITLDLIWNKDISQELSQRKESSEHLRMDKDKTNGQIQLITKLVDSVDLFDTLQISRELDQFPQVQQAIMGALRSLERDDPDIERNCITSCRASIEALCIEIGQEKDWKNALNNIFPSETDQKQVKGVWNFLSGKGAHGGHTPTRSEAVYSLQLTIGTLKFIIGDKGS